MDREQVKAVVDLVVKEVEGFFSLIRSDEALTFDNSLGRYAGVYNSKGYPSEEECARDCSLVNGVAVAPYYCVTGVPADVVLSITKPPVIPGVTGTGGGCASEDTGRPTWIVFAWIQKIVGFAGETTEELLAEHRPLIIHEIIHGLGFSNINFRSATDSQGERKGLVTRGKVEDLDGATDEVWFFRKGRAYELAQNYFGCTSNGSWDGLPLMGLPELGRASHWETRIMRDDIMSFGNTLNAVSSITLAAMEDLGWYLANYSAAQCMSWGYQQGCDYVKTRCGRGINDLSQKVPCPELPCEEGPDDCKGEGSWSHPDPYLADKCEKGINPCSQGSDNQEFPFNQATFMCNAQCYTGADREGCAPCTPAPAASTAPARHTRRTRRTRRSCKTSPTSALETRLPPPSPPPPAPETPVPSPSPPPPSPETPGKGGFCNYLPAGQPTMKVSTGYVAFKALSNTNLPPARALSATVLQHTVSANAVLGRCVPSVADPNPSPSPYGTGGRRRGRVPGGALS